MRAVVRDRFYSFNAPMEGEVGHLYVDVKGLVSIGVGHMVDPVALAVHLPLKRADGSLASRDEIVAEWARIKSLPGQRGLTAAQLGHTYARAFTRLHMTKQDLELLLLTKLSQNDAFLRHRFAEFEEWPADAQLATHSLSWACGPAFRFPKLEAALRTRDWTTASVECFMSEERTIGGLRPRNKANRILFRNASRVDALGLSPDLLYWPRDLEADPVSPEDETLDEPREPFAIVHALPDTNPNDDEPPEAA